MRLRVPLLAGLLMVAVGSAASAGLIVKTDMNTAVAGVQPQREVMIGDVIDVGVWLDLTQPSKMESYWFTMRFDAEALEFVGRTESYASGWGPIMSGSRPEPVYGTGDSILGPGQYGELRAFEGGSFSSILESPLMLQAATLTFKVKAAPAAGWLTQITSGIFDPDFDGYFDSSASDQLIPYESAGGGIVVVPEPSSLVLIGIGAMAGTVTLIARRRVRRS